MIQFKGTKIRCVSFNSWLSPDLNRRDKEGERKTRTPPIRLGPRHCVSKYLAQVGSLDPQIQSLLFQDLTDLTRVEAQCVLFGREGVGPGAGAGGEMVCLLFGVSSC